ncbi:hypothetical protein HY250_02810 [Candidatus Azambacteria bacterium]|nr:hypothetical protein [Candidatus Azambacteria bacterium]
MAIIISKNGKNAVRVDKSTFEKEDYLQKYIYENPESIPLYDIKEDIKLLILAREFPTNSGPIDAIGIDKDGEIYIVETKLYKNPDKRTVIAQVLDYGAALWKHSGDFSEFSSILDSSVQKTFKVLLNQKLQEYFGLSNEELGKLLDSVKNNLNDGVLHFVILMDSLDDRLKDLILYVNQNSEFDIYAVELEYYKHDTYEIIIPKIYGAEVKKGLPKTRSAGRLWNWDLFKQRLQEFGAEEVRVAEQVIDWSGKNGIEIEWSNSQRGGFFLCYYPDGKKGFYPFGVTGDAMVSWNVPHAGNKSPVPFDKLEKRAEILKRLKSIKGAAIDLGNVDGFNGMKLPLRELASESARTAFFSVCLWIKEALEAK